MLILAADASGAACSVAVARDGAIVARRALRMTRGHASALTPLIAETLAAAGVDASSLDALAVSTGPGSFTGLRIGMAAMKGLAVALDRPLIGVSGFDAVMRRAGNSSCRGGWDAAVVALESQREEIYVRCEVPDGGCPIPGTALSVPDLFARLVARFGAVARIRVTGDAARRVADGITTLGRPHGFRVTIGETDGPDAGEIALLAHDALGSDDPRGNGYRPGQAPVYLRAAAVTAPAP